MCVEFGKQTKCGGESRSKRLWFCRRSALCKFYRNSTYRVANPSLSPRGQAMRNAAHSLAYRGLALKCACTPVSCLWPCVRQGPSRLITLLCPCLSYTLVAEIQSNVNISSCAFVEGTSELMSPEYQESSTRAMAIVSTR